MQRHGKGLRSLRKTSLVALRIHREKRGGATLLYARQSLAHNRPPATAAAAK
jgi:hypothetical protein